MIDLSIIIVTYNSETDIGPCLKSLFEEVKFIAHEVFVVDNNSKDQTVKVVREQFPEVRLIANDYNAGFPGGNNMAIARASGRHLLLLNPDTLVCPGSIRTLLDTMNGDPLLGACGPRLVDGEGREAADIRRLTLWSFTRGIFLGTHLQRPILPPGKVEILSGAALLTSRQVIENLGTLDENLFWREDVDFCVRILKAGLKVRIVREATIIHLEGRSGVSNFEVFLEKPISSTILYFAKHYGLPAAIYVTVALWLETLLRLAKWQALAMIRSTPETDQRLAAFRKIIHRFPGYIRNAYRLAQRTHSLPD